MLDKLMGRLSLSLRSTSMARNRKANVRSASMQGDSLGIIEVAKTKHCGLLEDHLRNHYIPPVDHNGTLVPIPERRSAKTPANTCINVPMDVLDPMVSRVGLAKEESVAHGYRLGEIIGMGVFSHVHIGLIRKDQDPMQSTKNRKYCALKVMDQRRVTAVFREKFLPREILALQMCRGHTNVVKFLDCFQTSHHVYIVTEYCDGGTLLNYINSCYAEVQSGVIDTDAQHIFRQICLGLRYCHNRGIAHRDLKCENILLDQQNNVKIADFGFAYIVGTYFKREQLHTLCGSYMYSAPEILMGFSYDGFLADIWSTGIILFAIVNGKLPYSEDRLKEVTESMRFQRLLFINHAPPNAVQLAQRILQWDPESRPSLTEILQFPFLRKTSSPSKSAPTYSFKSVSMMSPSFSLTDQNRVATVKISEVTGEIIRLKSRVRSLKMERLLGSYPLMDHRRSSHFIPPPLAFPVEPPKARRATLLDELEARLMRQRHMFDKPDAYKEDRRRSFVNNLTNAELPFVEFNEETSSSSQQASDTSATLSDGERKAAADDCRTGQTGGIECTGSADKIKDAFNYLHASDDMGEKNGTGTGNTNDDANDVSEKHRTEENTNDAADGGVKLHSPANTINEESDYEEINKALDDLARTTLSSLSLDNFASLINGDPQSVTNVNCNITADPRCVTNINCDITADLQSVTNTNCDITANTTTVSNVKFDRTADTPSVTNVNGDEYVDASSPSRLANRNDGRGNISAVYSNAWTIRSSVLAKPKVAPSRYPPGEQSFMADPDTLHESLHVNGIQRGTKRAATHSIGGVSSRVLTPSLLGSRRSSAPPKYIVRSGPRHKRHSPRRQLSPGNREHAAAAQGGIDLHADLCSEGWRNKSPGNTHSRWQTSTTKKHKYSQRFCEKSAYTVKIDSHELAQYSFVNTSSNANAVSFDANVSSADEMYENEENYKRMESVARYTSYYRFLLGTRQAASVKPSGRRTVNTREVVSLQ